MPHIRQVGGHHATREAAQESLQAALSLPGMDCGYVTDDNRLVFFSWSKETVIPTLFGGQTWIRGLFRSKEVQENPKDHTETKAYVVSRWGGPNRDQLTSDIMWNSPWFMWVHLNPDDPATVILYLKPDHDINIGESARYHPQP